MASCLLCVSVAAQQRHSATFSDFSYEGHDAWYDEHPLTSTDQAYNPILPGWYSDPSICADGKGNYYLVTSTFGHYPGVPLFHSKDLMNWQQKGSILTRPEQLPLDGNDMGKGGIYAASMFYNKHNQTYYMITTNLGRMMKGKPGNFLVKSKDPEEEWSDPIYLQNMMGIDPSMFFEDDGRAYIVYSNWTKGRDYPGHCKIVMQEYDMRGDSIITSTEKVLADKGAFPKQNPTSLEGPHLYKINGKYYLMCAEGGTELKHSEVIFRSDSLWGDYKAWDKNPILTQRNLERERKNGVYCTGHADIFQDYSGKWWSVFLGTRMIDGKFENLGRETFLMPLRWTKDGWPVITEEGEQVPLIVTIPGAKRGERPTFGNFSVEDSFDNTVLAPYWQTVRGSATNKYSLTIQPGNLLLECSPCSASDKSGSPAFVGRRLQHHSFTATTNLSFAPSAGERAGLLLLKSEDRQYFLALGREQNNYVIEVLRIGDKGAVESLAKCPIGNDYDVALRISSTTGLTFEFAYSLNDGKTWNTVIKGVDAGHLATKVETTASSFTGTLVGMYAVSGL